MLVSKKVAVLFEYDVELLLPGHLELEEDEVALDGVEGGGVSEFVRLGEGQRGGAGRPANGGNGTRDQSDQVWLRTAEQGDDFGRDASVRSRTLGTGRGDRLQRHPLLLRHLVLDHRLLHLAHEIRQTATFMHKSRVQRIAAAAAASFFLLRRIQIDAFLFGTHAISATIF